MAKLTNVTKIRISLTAQGYMVMDHFLTKKLDILYNYKKLAGTHNYDNFVEDNINYVENMRIAIMKESFEIPFQDLIQIFPNGIDSNYIKDGVVEIVEE